MAKSSYTFIKQALTKPKTVGAVIPSSKYLANKFIQASSIGTAKTIVELGCGTGVMTDKIIEHKVDEAQFIAIELNTELASSLKSKFPDLNLFNECATSLKSILQKEGADFADTIISSLPWASFSLDLQYRLMDAVVDSMNSESEFLTFTYAGANKLPSGKRFLNMLNQKFSSVHRTDIIWANFPPAFIYHCKL